MDEPQAASAKPKKALDAIDQVERRMKLPGMKVSVTVEMPSGVIFEKDGTILTGEDRVAASLRDVIYDHLCRNAKHGDYDLSSIGVDFVQVKIYTPPRGSASLGMQAVQDEE